MYSYSCKCKTPPRKSHLIFSFLKWLTPFGAKILSLLNDSCLLAPKHSRVLHFTLYSWSYFSVGCSTLFYSWSTSLIGSAYLFLYINFCFRFNKTPKNLTSLHQHLLQYIQKNRELPERLTRSPRAIKTIKDLEAAIAIFAPVKPTPEYEVSEYATGNKCLRCNSAQHLVPIQDQLLLHDIQTRQEKNRLLGEKVSKIVLQNQLLAQQASSMC